MDRLLWDAKGLDETGDLYDLVRRAAPDAWEGLSGRTLMAHDLRIAAEILARTVEMAEDVVVADDRHEIPVGAQRLSTRSRDLEDLLTTNGLSPHPSLVVIVEGQTEHRLLPRVMETLGHPVRPDRIRIENREGIDEPIHLLARYAARPTLGNGFDKWVFLVIPEGAAVCQVQCRPEGPTPCFGVVRPGGVSSRHEARRDGAPSPAGTTRAVKAAGAARSIWRQHQRGVRCDGAP